MDSAAAPIELLRRMEVVCEGEPIDEIIFCCGVIVGQLVTQIAQPADYEELIAGYLDAIRAALNGYPTRIF